VSDDLGDDPGWQLSWKTLVSTLVPGSGLGIAKNGAKDSLQLLRSSCSVAASSASAQLWC
jgi:hypothetical protein